MTELGRVGKSQPEGDSSIVSASLREALTGNAKKKDGMFAQ